jgi:hypothetical protein
MPSVSTLRRICDYFGIDEYEIFLNTDELKNIIEPKALKRRISKKSATEITIFGSGDLDFIREFLGYYHIYVPSNHYRDSVIRSIMRVSRDGNQILTHTKDLNIDLYFKLPKTINYKGIVSGSNNKYIIHERQMNDGESFATYMINPAKEGENFLTGILLISLPDSQGEIAGMRVVLQSIGLKPNIRESLKECGLFKGRHRGIPPFVRHYLLEPKGSRYFSTNL